MTIARQIILLLTMMFSCFACLNGAEYFVAGHGNNSNDGLSPDKAFLTIQRGIDALEPGDTLTIAPGEYSGSVEREDLGSPDIETVIRAAIPGTVLLRGDVPAPSFRKVDGFRFVYSADFEGDIQAVNEVDTCTILETATTADHLEFDAGSCLYDPESARIYISTSDLQPPEHHTYTLSVTPRFGLLLTRPTRVVVDGLAVTGFTSRKHAGWDPGSGAFWGIMIDGGRGCVIRNCIAFLNGGGIALRSDADSRDNLIERCTAYGNYSKHCTEGGNIIGFSTHYDVIRNCYAYKGRPNGIRFYGASIRGPVALRDNLAWGNYYTDFFIKGGKAYEFGVAERCISLGICHAANVTNCVIGTYNQYNRTPPRDNIMYASFPQQQKGFADPENLDYRLQGDSQYRGTGPGGTDRGAFPYKANIFYVGPDGDDAADGLSAGKAWRTLQHALEGRKAGDTLYLEGGTYRAGLELTLDAPGSEPLRILGRGRIPVIVSGTIRIAEAAALNIERIAFENSVVIANSKNVAIKNCVFGKAGASLKVSGTQGLRVTHSLFAGGPLIMEKTSGIFLAGNLYSHAPALRVDSRSKIQYSDYNAYAGADRCMTSGTSTLNLEALRSNRHDRYSLPTAPKLTVDSGLAHLLDSRYLAGRGPNGTDIGIHREFNTRPIRIEGPLVHSAGSTTANLEWWTSSPAVCKVAWGPTRACANTNMIQAGTFNTFSLTGLQPGHVYHFRIVSADPADKSTAQTVFGIQPETRPIDFRTASAQPGPATYYVAADGDDSSSGLSTNTPWRTIIHAADRVRAGDTVVIRGGSYPESVFLRTSGDRQRPVTFKAYPGEKVTIDGSGRMLPVAFTIIGKHHINIDGFYLRHFGMNGWDGVVNIFNSSHVRITRCYSDGGGVGYPGQMLRTRNCSDITVQNCVIANNFQGMYIQSTADMRIENNVFLRNMICAFLSSGSPPRGLYAANNIFVDSGPYKVRVHMFELGGIDPYVFTNNCFYLRAPDEERKPFLFYGKGPGRLSIAEYDATVTDSCSLQCNPEFSATLDMKPIVVKGIEEPFLGDRTASIRGLDFPGLFATNPELVKRGIGLQPEAFEGFGFEESQVTTDGH